MDLNVGKRVNTSCTSPTTNGCISGTDPLIFPTVGCWAHATHVAGIIGARSNNQGVSGINAGMKIVSVSAASTWSYWDGIGITCGAAKDSITSASVIAALDWIRSDIYRQNRFRPGIVNISMNNPAFLESTIKSKMLALASGRIGGTYYAGAFIVQSAGNHNDLVYHSNGNACAVSYNDTSFTDGIMVVGAVGRSGSPVVTGFYPATIPQTSSNYGPCVEIWAPGDNVLSTWSDIPLSHPGCHVGHCQRGGITYTAYQKLGGTSMAAPHIAGVAAYLAETLGLTSAPAIEAAVRQYMYTLGTSDLSGETVYMVQLP